MKRWSVHRGPHGVDISVVVFTWAVRVLVVCCLLSIAVWTGSRGRLDGLGIPFVTFQPPVTASLLGEWCPDIGSWPPEAYCYTEDGPLYQGDWEAFYRQQRGWPRLSPYAHTRVHPWTIAVLILGLAWIVYRKTRPVDIQVRANGIRIDGRFVHRDRLRGCEIHHWIWLPVIVIHLDEGKWQSPPLRMQGWRVESLVEEIRSLLPSASEAEESIAAGFWMKEDAKTLLDSAQVRRFSARSATSHSHPAAEREV